MPAIAFLPWLGLRRKERVAGIEIVPLGEFLPLLGSEERSWLERYFRCYRRRDGMTPVDTICVIADEGHERIEATIRALAVCSLVYEHAESIASGNPTWPPPRAERWSLYFQSFDASQQFVAPCEGYTTCFFPLEKFVEVEPLSPGGRVKRLGDCVSKMAEALVQEAEKDADLATALDLLREGALTNDRHLRLLNIVFVGSALELLSGAKGERNKGAFIAGSLADAVRRCQQGPPGASDPQEREFLGGVARQVDPELVRLWMEGCRECKDPTGHCARHRQPFAGFYQRRNRVVHEGRLKPELLRHQCPDNGEYHCWEEKTDKGAHVADVVLVMSGWLLVDRVAGRLPEQTWFEWCELLARTASHLGMATT